MSRAPLEFLERGSGRREPATIRARATPASCCVSGATAAAGFNSGFGETSPVRQRELTFLRRRLCQEIPARPREFEAIQTRLSFIGSKRMPLPPAGQTLAFAPSAAAAETYPAIVCPNRPGSEGQVTPLTFSLSQSHTTRTHVRVSRLTRERIDFRLVAQNARGRSSVSDKEIAPKYMCWVCTWVWC